MRKRKLRALDVEIIMGFYTWRKGTDVPKSYFACWHDDHNVAAVKRISGVRKGLVVGPCFPMCKRRDSDARGVTVIAFDKRKFKKHYTPLLIARMLSDGGA